MYRNGLWGYVMRPLADISEVFEFDSSSSSSSSCKRLIVLLPGRLCITLQSSSNKGIDYFKYNQLFHLIFNTLHKQISVSSSYFV